MSLIEQNLLICCQKPVFGLGNFFMGLPLYATPPHLWVTEGTKKARSPHFEKRDYILTRLRKAALWGKILKSKIGLSCVACRLPNPNKIKQSCDCTFWNSLSIWRQVRIKKIHRWSLELPTSMHSKYSLYGPNQSCILKSNDEILFWSSFCLCMG